jgi:hypothetical protein
MCVRLNCKVCRSTIALYFSKLRVECINAINPIIQFKARLRVTPPKNVTALNLLLPVQVDWAYVLTWRNQYSLHWSQLAMKLLKEEQPGSGPYLVTPLR